MHSWKETQNKNLFIRYQYDNWKNYNFREFLTEMYFMRSKIYFTGKMHNPFMHKKFKIIVLEITFLNSAQNDVGHLSMVYSINIKT